MAGYKITVSTQKKKRDKTWAYTNITYIYMGESQIEPEIARLFQVDSQLREASFTFAKRRNSVTRQVHHYVKKEI